MTEQNRTQEAALEALFATAKDTAPLPDAALLQRVLSDAAQVQAGFAAAAVPEARRAWPERPRRRAQVRLGGLFEMIGGWAGLGGLATASAFGLWLGMTPVLGLGETLAAQGFGSAAVLDGLGEDYAYLADLGEN